MFGSYGASATPRTKALHYARFLLFPLLGFPSIASTWFGQFFAKVVARFILGQFILKWLGSPHSKQVGLGLSLAALPVQYQHTDVALVLAPEQSEQSSFQFFIFYSYHPFLDSYSDHSTASCFQHFPIS
ncbi:hypothetical protein Tco_1303642 [Tanacetum coccineum]